MSKFGYGRLCDPGHDLIAEELELGIRIRGDIAIGGWYMRYSSLVTRVKQSRPLIVASECKWCFRNRLISVAQSGGLTWSRD